jgi:hypothetical protein
MNSACAYIAKKLHIGIDYVAYRQILILKGLQFASQIDSHLRSVYNSLAAGSQTDKGGAK